MTAGGAELDVTMRPATPEDLPFLKRMCYEAAFGGQNVHTEKPPSFEEAMDIPWIRDYVDGWGREGDYGLIAVGPDGQDIGAAWYRHYSGDLHVRPYELTIAVREEDRRKHVGEALMKNLLDHADEEGIGRLGLQVGEDNAAAMSMYRKLGFEVVGEKDEYDNYTMTIGVGEAPAAGESGGEGSRDREAQGYKVGGYFDAFAPLHDRYAVAGEWPAKVDGFIRTAVGYKRGGPIRSVLDLGVGTGLSVEAILSNTDPERLVGVDISPGMLERLRERYDESVVETILKGIEDYVPESEETFDLIASMTTLEFVEDLPRVLKGIPRLLNDNGIFAATYLPRAEGDEDVRITDSPYLRQRLVAHRWPQGQIEDSLTSQGLKIVHRDSSLPAYQVHGKWIYYNFIVGSKS